MSDRAVGVYSQWERYNFFQCFTAGCDQRKAESWEKELIQAPKSFSKFRQHIPVADSGIFTLCLWFQKILR